jgi:hypothetical protein
VQTRRRKKKENGRMTPARSSGSRFSADSQRVQCSDSPTRLAVCAEVDDTGAIELSLSQLRAKGLCDTRETHLDRAEDASFEIRDRRSRAG